MGHGKGLFGIVMFLLFPSCLIFTLPSTVKATDYYVSPSGNDIFNGSQSMPWKTIQKAVDSVAAGDLIYIRDGNYTESIVLKQSGTASAPIYIKAYSQEVPVVNGGNNMALYVYGGVSYWNLQGLTFQSNNRYTVQLGWWGEPAVTNIVFKNNRVFGSFLIKGSNNLIENNNVSGIYPNGTKYGNFSGQGEGDAGLMDIDGSHHNIFRSNQVHDFSNVDGRGIWTQGYTHDDLFENNIVTNIIPTGGVGQSIDLDGAATIEWNHTVRGNKVVGNNYVGIQLENVFNSLIENNVVSNTGSAGIIVVNYGPDVGCPTVGTSGTPYGDTNGNGTCKDELTNNIIRQNLITTSSGWGWGYGGITNWGSRAVKLLGNTIYSAYGSGNGGINYQDPDNFSDHAVIQGNIIASANSPAVCSSDSLNIFTSDDHNLLYNGNGGIYATGSDCSNLINLSAYQSSTGKGTGSLQANPLFKSTSDFHLQVGSPAIDRGIPIGLTADLDGIPKPQGLTSDMGAYEYPSGVTPYPSTPPPTVTALPTVSPTSVPVKPGDANFDNQVNENDFIIWLDNYLQPVYGQKYGDFDLNSYVDGVDYIIWLNHFGN